MMRNRGDLHVGLFARPIALAVALVILPASATSAEANYYVTVGDTKLTFPVRENVTFEGVGDPATLSEPGVISRSITFRFGTDPEASTGPSGSFFSLGLGHIQSDGLCQSGGPVVAEPTTRAYRAHPDIGATHIVYSDKFHFFGDPILVYLFDSEIFSPLTNKYYQGYRMSRQIDDKLNFQVGSNTDVISIEDFPLALEKIEALLVEWGVEFKLPGVANSADCLATTEYQRKPL